MSTHEPDLALADCRDVLTAAVRDGRTDGVSGERLREVISAALKAYVAKREAGEDLTIVADSHDMSATEIVVVCQALLDAANLEPFELSMWSRLGRL